MFNETNSKAIIRKSKNIFWIFFCIFGIYIKFGILWQKTWAWEVICFWIYRLQKAGLLKCLKSRVSEHLSTVNTLKRPKHCINFPAVYLSYFLSTLKGNQLKKLCCSSIWNLEAVSWHNDTQWQAFSLSKSECLTQPNQMVLSPN